MHALMMPIDIPRLPVEPTAMLNWLKNCLNSPICDNRLCEQPSVFPHGQPAHQRQLFRIRSCTSGKVAVKVVRSACFIIRLFALR